MDIWYHWRKSVPNDQMSVNQFLSSLLQNDVYKITDPTRLGHAIIINNVKSQYEGSEKDTDALMIVYKMMNFEVSLYEDCTEKVINGNTWFILSWNQTRFYSSDSPLACL